MPVTITQLFDFSGIEYGGKQYESGKVSGCSGSRQAWITITA
jgi:hypothetical protein